MGVSVVDGARMSLQILATVDAVMLALPLSVIGSMQPRRFDGESIDACGWTPSSLYTTCIAAICCLCFSLVLAGGQLMTISVAGSHQSTAYAQLLLRHLPLPIVVTGIGGLIGAVALWGHGVLQHGECNPESLALLISAFSLAYLAASVYLYLSPICSRSLVVPEREESLLPVVPAHSSSEHMKMTASIGEPDMVLQMDIDLERQLKRAAEAAALVEEQQSAEGKLKSDIEQAFGQTNSIDSRASRNSRSSHRASLPPRRKSGRLSERSTASERSGSRRASEARPGSRRASGIDGKTGSPLTAGETRSKPDRFEKAFDEHRHSLNSMDGERMEKIADLAITTSRETVVTTTSEREPPRKSSLLVAPRKSSIKPNANANTSADGEAASPTSRKSVCIMEANSIAGICVNVTQDTADSHTTAFGVDKRDSHVAMLDLAVHHYHDCPINFNTCEERSNSSGSGGSSDDGGGQEVSVPLWLMDQNAQRKSHENYESNSSEDEDDEEECSADSEVGDMVSPLTRSPMSDASINVSGECRDRRISFLDQVTGTSFEQYSKGKKQAKDKEKTKGKKINLAVRSGSAPACTMQGSAQAPASMFWKVPRPTRRGTMMPAPIVRGALNRETDKESFAEGDEEEGSSKKPKRPANQRLKSALTAPNLGSNEPSAGMLSPPSTAEAPVRRPSVLSVFNESGVKKEGHYELPQFNQDTGEKSSEVVEVRRQSLVVSKSMITDLMLQKLDRDQFVSDRDIDAIHEAEDEHEPIILPFFIAPLRDTFKKCNCKVDPETGIVIHTCMTPAATMCENTQTYQSYVCSEWGTRHHSRKASKAATKHQSRRTSLDHETSEDDEESRRREKKKTAEDRMQSKRIRNASMLAVVGRAAPAPGKQNTHSGDNDDTKSEGSDNGKPEESENELHVSFRSLNQMSNGQMEVEFSGVAGRTAPEDAGQFPLDVQAENELCHRFELTQPWELAEMLQNPDSREQVLVVDARGRDWVGAHIPLSINLRTSEICSHPESLLKQCFRNRINHLVFTCMYSVLRARKSAVAVQGAQQEAHNAGLQPYRIRISLLAGGMHGWVNYWINNGKDVERQNPYIQDFDQACWCDGGPSQGGLVHVMDALWSEGGQQALSDALVAELSALASFSSPSSANASRRVSTDKGDSRGDSKEDTKEECAAKGKRFSKQHSLTLISPKEEITCQMCRQMTPEEPHEPEALVIPENIPRRQMTPEEAEEPEALVMPPKPGRQTSPEEPQEPDTPVIPNTRRRMTPEEAEDLETLVIPPETGRQRTPEEQQELEKLVMPPKPGRQMTPEEPEEPETLVFPPKTCRQKTPEEPKDTETPVMQFISSRQSSRQNTVISDAAPTDSHLVENPDASTMVKPQVAEESVTSKPILSCVAVEPSG